MKFDFVVNCTFMRVQMSGFFTFIPTLDAIYDAVAYIVVNFKMGEVHMIL